MATYDVIQRERKVQLQGNGTAGPFQFLFQIESSSHLKVYVDDVEKQESSHYTVTINADGSGGSISFTSSNFPTSSETVTLISDIPLSRTSIYTSGGDLTAQSLESDFDTSMFIHQQTNEEVNRSIRLPEYDVVSSDTMILPAKADRLGKTLGFHSTTGALELKGDYIISISSDSGSGTVDTQNSETLTITGGEGIDTSLSGQTFTISGEDASTTNKGIANFSSTYFSVNTGTVSLKPQQYAINLIGGSTSKNIDIRDSTFRFNFDGTWQSSTPYSFDTLTLLNGGITLPGNVSINGIGLQLNKAQDDFFIELQSQNGIPVRPFAIQTNSFNNECDIYFDRSHLYINDEKEIRFVNGQNFPGAAIKLKADTSHQQSDGHRTVLLPNASGTIMLHDGSGNVDITGNLTTAGNLTVNGTTTTVNTATLSVEDPLISLANGNNSTDSVDIGFYGLYDTTGSQDLYAGFFRDASDDKFKLFKGLQTEPTSTVNLSGTGYTTATLVSNLEGNVTGDLTGNVTGNVTGDLTGAVTGNVTGDVTGNLTGNVTGDVTGNASTATALETARTIAGQSFDGTANITIASTDLSDSGSIDATTLDSIDSTSFLRSDVADTKTVGDLSFNDNVKAVFGTDSDLEIFHFFNQGYIVNNTNNLNINNTADGSDVIINTDNGSGLLTTYFKADGSTGEVQLHHYGSEKLATKSTGVEINGGVIDVKNDGTQSELRLYCESNNAHYASLQAPAHADFTGNVTLTLPANTGTLISTANSDTPTTTTTSSDADHILIDDGGVMKKITPTNLGIGSGGITVQDEGSSLSTEATTLDFVGAGVVASGTGSTKTITIAGGSDGVTVQDEGSSLATTGTTLNFVGDGVVASGTGATKTITISGSSGGGGGTTSETYGASLSGKLAVLHSVGTSNTLIGNGGTTSLSEPSASITSSANNNTSLGAVSAYSLTSGYNNTLLGSQSGYSINTGYNNSFIGANAGLSLSTGRDNVMIGYNAGSGCTDDYENVYIGNTAGRSSVTGSSNYRNVAIGHQSLQSSSRSSANYHVSIGWRAGYNITTSDNTVNIGHVSDNLSQNGESVSIGAYAQGNYRSVNIGYQAFASGSSTSYYNTLIGYQAGYDMDGGDHCVFVGYRAGYAGGSANNNIGVGNFALDSLSTGANNTSVGYGSLNRNTSGSTNSGFGLYSGEDFTTGNNNTLIGAYAGGNTTSSYTGSNNILLGYSLNASSTSVSNEITLGNTSITSLRCNVQTITSLSDQRDKTAIEDLDLGLDFIKAMKPRKFVWNRRDGTWHGRKEIGFIAQELHEVEMDFSSTDKTRLVSYENPSKLEASPMNTYPILIKAIQELSAKVDSLQARITELEGE